MEALRTGSDWVMYAGMAVAMYGGAQWPRPAWGIVAAGIAVIGGGVAMRRAAGAPKLESGEGSGDTRRAPRKGTLIDALVELTAGVEALSAESESAALEAIKARVEDLVWIGPERVGAAQEAIAAKVGFSVYAEVMTPLATCERWLNRAWSAAADGHRPECTASLQTALTFAREASALAQQRFTTL